MAVFTTTISMSEDVTDQLGRIKLISEKSASQVISDLITIYGDAYVKRVKNFYISEVNENGKDN